VQAQGCISLSLLQSFDLRIDDRPVHIPLSSQRVVAFLVLNRGRLARTFVAGNLWMDASEERAAAALRTALWRLGHLRTRLVCCHGPRLSIQPAVIVDIDVATRSARDALDDRTDVPVAPMVVTQLRDDGELLPDWYDDWVLIERERFRQLRLHALEALCHRLSREHCHSQATEIGLAAVASEPLRESAHRALISAHLREGNAVEALRQYRLFKWLLHRELGLDPSPQLELLVRTSLQRDDAVTAMR
jgi:DNA-binding SARP family transcriptional activator